MTITIDLPEETAANLRERARAQARPAAELVTEVIIERFGTDYDPDDSPLDADAVEKIQRGLAEVKVGQTLSLEEARADFRATSALREWAQAQGRPAAELVIEAVLERFGTDPDAVDSPLDDDALEKIRRGFADMDAGRTMSLEDSRARVEGLLTARHTL